MLGLLEEVREGTGVELSLEELAAVEELLAGRVERAVQDGEELERGGREDLLVAACRSAESASEQSFRRKMASGAEEAEESDAGKGGGYGSEECGGAEEEGGSPSTGPVGEYAGQGRLVSTRKQAPCSGKKGGGRVQGIPCPPGELAAEAPSDPPVTHSLSRAHPAPVKR